MASILAIHGPRGKYLDSERAILHAGERPTQRLAAAFLEPAALSLAAPGFVRSAARNSAVGRVLMTSFFSSQPRRAMVTPYRMKARFPVLWESVEMTTLTPRSLHIRRYTSFRSRRSG